MAAIKLNVPKWVEELASPRELFIDSLLSSVMAKAHEYKNEEEYYQNKYQKTFPVFEKKVKTLKQENFEMYDDYILWKAAHFLCKKWSQRYSSLIMGRS